MLLHHWQVLLSERADLWVGAVLRLGLEGLHHLLVILDLPVHI